MLEARDRPLFAILVVLALLVGCAIVARLTESPQQSPHQSTQQTQADNAAAPQQPDRPSFWRRTVDDPINLFTGVLAVLTIALVGASIWQGYLTRRSIELTHKSLELGRQEFISTHRPRLRIRNIAGPFPADDGTVRFKVVIANVGETSARLVGDWFSVFEVHGKKQEHDFAMRENTLTGSLDPGKDILMQSGNYYVLEYQTRGVWDPRDDVPVIVMGFVSYLDEGGEFTVKRITGYARDYNVFTDELSVSKTYAHGEYED